MISLVKKLAIPSILGMMVLSLLVSANTTFGQSNSTGITLEKQFQDEKKRYEKEKNYLEKLMLSNKKRANQLYIAARAALQVETPDSVVVQKRPTKNYMSKLNQIEANKDRRMVLIDEDYKRNLKRAEEEHEEFEANLLRAKAGEQHHALIGEWEGRYTNTRGESGRSSLNFFYANSQLMVEHNGVRAEVKPHGERFLFRMEFPSYGVYTYSVAMDKNGKKMTVDYINLAPRKGGRYSGTLTLSK